MANEHVAMLKQCVAAWNARRRENPDVRPNLSEVYLWGAHLIEAHLNGAKLSGANLTEAKLFLARLIGAKSQRGEPQRGEARQGEPPRGESQRGGIDTEIRWPIGCSHRTQGRECIIRSVSEHIDRLYRWVEAGTEYNTVTTERERLHEIRIREELPIAFEDYERRYFVIPIAPDAATHSPKGDILQIITGLEQVSVEPSKIAVDIEDNVWHDFNPELRTG
jgi:hypothetical protein